MTRIFSCECYNGGEPLYVKGSSLSEVWPEIYNEFVQFFDCCPEEGFLHVVIDGAEDLGLRHCFIANPSTFPSII